jgi:hypothetical protein
MLVTLLLLIVFAPALRWGWQALCRTQPVHVGNVEAVVPRAWMIREKKSRLEVWKPCLTVFCTYPSASMSFMWDGRVTCSQDIVMHSVGVVFAQQGFTDPQVRDVNAGLTTLECLEAKRPGQPGRVIRACFKVESCVLGNFEGNAGDQAAFSRIIETTRHNLAQQAAGEDF